MINNINHSNFLQFKLLPSGRQLVHHEVCSFTVAPSDQRLLGIPASCHRVSGDNPNILYYTTFFTD